MLFFDEHVSFPFSENSLSQEKSTVSFSDYGIRNYEGEIVYIANPEREVQLDPARATDEERRFHADHFSGSYPQRTPEIYMKIRNHILQQW